MTFTEFISKLESNGDPHAFGDKGQALTSFQVHPAWVIDWSQRLHVEPRVNDTWERFVGRIVEVFGFHACETLKLGRIEAAMYFHIGHVVWEGEQDWDEQYAARARKILLSAQS